MASLVKRRFDSLDLEDISCKIAVYDIGALKSFDGDGKVRRLFHEMTSYGTANLNCTEVVTSDVRSGEPDQYGNYSGVVGMVQSGVSDHQWANLTDSIVQEVDFAYMYMRLDCLNSDTLGVMAPIYAAGVRIVSPILDHGDSQDNVLPTSASDTFEPFLDTLTLVDGPSYCLICVAILTVAMVISFENGRMLPRRQLVTVFTGSLWNVFQLMVSQGKFRHKTVLLQSLWLLLTVGLFVIISGLFLNLLRTEKVAQRNPDQIETIDDINGTKFDRFEPKLIPNAFTYALRHQVKQGTKEGQIFKKVLKRKDNLVPLVSSNSNIIQFLYESMRTKDSYLLLEDLFWSPAKLMLCFVKPGNAIKVHTSRATVLDGILIVPFRPSVHLGFKLYVEHRLKNMFEMGLSGREFFGIFEAVATVTSQWEKSKENTTKCLLGMRDEAHVPEIQFKLVHSRVVLKTLAALLVVSAVCTLAEVVYGKSVKAKVPCVAITHRSGHKSDRGGATVPGEAAMTRNARHWVLEPTHAARG